MDCHVHFRSYRRNLKSAGARYSEKKKWTCPWIVVHLTWRMVTMQSTRPRKRKACNAFQVELYYCTLYISLHCLRINSISVVPFQISFTEFIHQNYSKASKFDDFTMKAQKRLFKSKTCKPPVEKKYLQRLVS